MNKNGLTISLIRHGETGYSGRYLGATDVGITSKGVEQITQIRSALPILAPETIWVSPMKRCRQSLAALLKETQYSGREIIIPELKEIDFGRWEKKSFAEVAQEEPERITQWAENKNFTFPEGESIANFRKRMEYIKKKIDTIESNSLLIVTHGGVIRSLICLLLGLGQEKYLLFDIAPARITEILYFKEGGILRRCNGKDLE